MKVFNRRSLEMGYDGKQIEPGEIFELLGLLNDKKLLDHSYVVEVPNRGRPPQRPKCDACNKTFFDDQYYLIHLNGRQHAQSPNYEDDSRTMGPTPTPREAALLSGDRQVGVPRY